MEFTTHFGLHSQTTRLEERHGELPTYLILHSNGPFTLYGPSPETILKAGLRMERQFREPSQTPHCLTAKLPQASVLG